MSKLFEKLKLIFFACAFFVGIFALRGYYFFTNEYGIPNIQNPYFQFISQILMAIFLVLAGCMIGYIIGIIWISKNKITNEDQINKEFKKNLIIGSIIGIVFAILFTLL